MSSERVISARDKDAYDAICKQIEREDLLYNSRFNYWMLLNFGLAAAAAKQFDPDSPLIVRAIIFFGCCIVALAMAFLSTKLFSLSDKQVAFLREEYHKGSEGGKFQGLPRPFFSKYLEDGKVDWPSEKHRAGAWYPLVAVVALAWLATAMMGTLEICREIRLY